MFDDIPDNYRSQTADTEEEGWRYTQGDKTARRPPELLTRDHVARCILREVREGRGSPHGGVFLDISWIREKLPDASKHIIRKLPSMYHQFKQLADIDITTTPMEVGPTTHYIMGGIKVDGDTQGSTVPGLFAAGECAAGLHGANRLGGNSLSDLLVFGKRAGEFAAAFARSNGPTTLDGAQVEDTARCALEPFERGAGSDGRGPYQLQQELQVTMQDLVGIVRTESEMREALGRIAHLQGAGPTCRRGREPGVQSGVAYRARSAQPAHRVGGHQPSRHRTTGKPRRPFPGRLSREGSRGGPVQHRHSEGVGGRDAALARADSRHAGRAEAGDRGAEVTDTLKPDLVDTGAVEAGSTPRAEPEPVGRATFRIWRGDGTGGELVDYTTTVAPGMVVLDAIHQIQAEQANDLAVRWNCKAGKCGSCSAEVNGMPKLMCMTRLSELRLDEPVSVEPMRAFRPIKDLVTDVSWNFTVKRGIKPFRPRAPDAPDGTWRMAQSDVDRVQEFRKCIECFLCQDVCHVLRDHQLHDAFIGPRFLVHAAALEMHPLDVEDRVPDLRRVHGIGYCNITKCCTAVCPEHITITDNAIIPLKERVVDEFFDPVGRLLKVFSRRETEA